MKIKKSVVALALSTSLLGMGTGVYAASSFYDELRGRIEMEVGQIDSNVNASYVVTVEEYRQQEYDRVEKEVMEYFESRRDDIRDRFMEGFDESTEKEKQKIHKEAEQKIKELKAYIDSVAGEAE